MVAPRDEGSAGDGGSPASIVVQRRIEWPDTDASGMYHNTAAFLRPLRFRDMVDIHLIVENVGRTSVTYRFEMRSGDEVAARGRAVAVLLSEAGGEPVQWPEEHRRRLLTAGPQRGERLAEA